MARISRVITAHRSINAIESACDTWIHSVKSRLAATTDEGIPGVRCLLTIYWSRCLRVFAKSTIVRTSSLRASHVVLVKVATANCHKLSVINDSVSGFIAWLMNLMNQIDCVFKFFSQQEVVICLRGSAISGRPRCNSESDTSTARDITDSDESSRRALPPIDSFPVETHLAPECTRRVPEYTGLRLIQLSWIITLAYSLPLSWVHVTQIVSTYECKSHDIWKSRFFH